MRKTLSLVLIVSIIISMLPGFTSEAKLSEQSSESIALQKYELEEVNISIDSFEKVLGVSELDYKNVKKIDLSDQSSLVKTEVLDILGLNPSEEKFDVESIYNIYIAEENSADQDLMISKAATSYSTRIIWVDSRFYDEGVKKGTGVVNVYLNRAFSVALGLTKDYIWIPATVFGIDLDDYIPHTKDKYSWESTRTVWDKHYQIYEDSTGFWISGAIAQKASVTVIDIVSLLDGYQGHSYYDTETHTSGWEYSSHYYDDNYLRHMAFSYYEQEIWPWREYVQ